MWSSEAGRGGVARVRLVCDFMAGKGGLQRDLAKPIETEEQ